jgi:uncharacterized membrane protein YjjP (DUF1212 family)
MHSADEILDIALESGRMILENGGETYRTEETMISIASSLGAETASAFVTPTVVMLTCLDAESNSRTRIHRVQTRTINLGKIARLNALSRRLVSRGKRSNLSQVDAILKRIDGGPLHHPLGVIGATAIASFCFSLLFRGSLAEASLSFVIGAAMRAVLFWVAPFGLSSFIVTVIGGLVISLMSGTAVATGLAASTGNISISVLMSLVPGVAIVNAIRDIIAGDLVAGSARLLDAFVIAAALSLGAAFGLIIFPAAPGYASAVLTWNSFGPAFFLSFFATAAFAYFFYINRYDIFWASLFGAIGWLVYIASGEQLMSNTAACMTGALCVGLLSEIAAFIFRKPATVYIIPGIIPLVPGGGMYETMLYSVLGNMDVASVIGFRTFSAAAAIAVAIAIASSLARFVFRVRLGR